MHPRRVRLQYDRPSLPLLSSLRHSLLLVAGERGPRCESLQSPDRDRGIAPKTASLTYPQPQTHAFGRAYQAPMPISGRSLPQSPAHISSLTSSSFRSYLNEAQSVASGKRARSVPTSPSVVSEATAEEKLVASSESARSLWIQRLQGSRPAVRSGAGGYGFSMGSMGGMR